MMKVRHLLSALSLCLLPAVAFAHPGHDAEGLVAGMMHPWLGMDHMIAMLAVGMWASQQNGRVRWAMPISFVGMMVIGAGIGFSDLHLGATEQMIAASVCVFGLVLSSLIRLPVLLSVVIVGSLAVFHGYAHATEATGGNTSSYMVGFVVSTALLHAAGFGAATLLSQHQRAIRWLGAAMAVGGVAILLG
jgi:urease accessory protein